MKTLATQMKAYGQQATDIADAVEKTRKEELTLTPKLEVELDAVTAAAGIPRS